MKIGICTNFSNAFLLPAGAADYIEINIAALSAMSDEEFEQTRNLISANNLSAQAANCFFPGDMRLCGNDFDILRIVDYTEHALKRVSELGIEVCVLGSGRARACGDNDDKEKCREEFAEVCRQIGDIARKYNIIVCIEPLNRNETNMITTVEDGAKLVREINHPNIRLLADFYHMAMENESLDCVCDNRDIIHHMHIANPDGRVFPMESDCFDYKAVLDILRKSGYDGRLSIEAGSKSDFQSGAVKSLEFLKEVFK